MKRFVLVFMVCLLLLVLTAQAAMADSGCRTWYRVKKGDTLWRISRWYGSTPKAIARASGIKNPNRIYPGEMVCIPKKAHPKPKPKPKCGFYYKVKKGDTFNSISYRYGVAPKCTKKVNRFSTPLRIWPGEKVWIPCKCQW